jgi:hypothetical protein
MITTQELESMLKEHEDRIVSKVIQALIPSKKLSRKEAAEFLGYSYDSMRSIPKNELPYEKVGKLWHYDMKDLQAYKLKKVAMTSY